MSDNNIYTVVDTPEGGKLALRTGSGVTITDLGNKTDPYVTVEVDGEEKQGLLVVDANGGGGSIPDPLTIGEIILTGERPVTFQDTVYDDMRVTSFDAEVAGSNPPSTGIFINDGTGTGGTTSAIRFIDNTGASAAMYTALETAIEGNQFTIEFWIKPEDASLDFILNFGSGIWVRLSSLGSNVGLYYDFGFTGFSSTFLNINSWNHVVMSVNKSTGDADIYINNIAEFDNIGTSTLIAGSTFYMGYEGSPTSSLNFKGSLDTVTVYDTLFTAAQVAERWNGGAGTASLPTGIVDGDRVMYTDLDDGSGSTISNTKGNDLAIVGIEDTDFEWTDGHIGLENPGSRGVALKFFPPDVETELYFTLQCEHSRKEGSDLEPHFHWSSLESGSAGEKVVWGLEWTWCNINDIIQSTTLATGNQAIDNTGQPIDITLKKSHYTKLPTIDGTGKSLSSQIVGRIFRKGQDAGDTFSHPAALIEFDFHFERDDAGSSQENHK